MHYRKPVQLLQKAVAKTQALTRPVEPFLDRGMAGAASLASTVKTKVCMDVSVCTEHGMYALLMLVKRNDDRDP